MSKRHKIEVMHVHVHVASDENIEKDLRDVEDWIAEKKHARAIELANLLQETAEGEYFLRSIGRASNLAVLKADIDKAVDQGRARFAFSEGSKRADTFEWPIPVRHVNT